jgi:hypothetical protein
MSSRLGSLPRQRRFVAALAAALLVLPLALAPRAEAFVYWADLNNETIGRANLDGRGVDDRFISGIRGLVTVAVDGRYIYWGGANGIGRARLDGTKVNETFIVPAPPIPMTRSANSRSMITTSTGPRTSVFTRDSTRTDRSAAPISTGRASRVDSSPGSRTW